MLGNGMGNSSNHNNVAATNSRQNQNTPSSMVTMGSPNLLLKQASAQTKADIQEIINKHQAAALLEANQNIRDLQQEREDHQEKINIQQAIIQHLNKERELEQAKESTKTKEQLEEIQLLKKQLRERDELIEKLQNNHPRNNGTHSPTSPSTTPSNDNNQEEELQTLKDTIEKLNTKVEQQQDEIDRLQSVLREIENFHRSNDDDEENQDQAIQEVEDSFDEEDALATSLAASIGKQSSVYSEETDDYYDELLDSQSQTQSQTQAQAQANHSNSQQHARRRSHHQKMTLNGNQLVLLISSMPGCNTVKANQKRLELILQGLELSPDEVQVLDGCDPTSINLRNDLFAISGKRAKYPQLFLVNFQQNELSFVGDFETIMDLHDSQSLEAAVGLTPLL